MVSRYGASPPKPCQVSLATVTRRTRSEVTLKGGSSKGLLPAMGMENLLRLRPRSYQTGAGNAITVPVGKRVEAVRDGPSFDAV